MVCGFLGNKSVDNYREVIDNLMSNCHAMGCRMSINVHFLHSHLDSFSPNMGAVSDEYRERSHQDIRVMEKRYQGSWDVSMMGDYAWQIKVKI